MSVAEGQSTVDRLTPCSFERLVAFLPTVNSPLLDRVRLRSAVVVLVARSFDEDQKGSSVSLVG